MNALAELATAYHLLNMITEAIEDANHCGLDHVTLPDEVAQRVLDFTRDNYKESK